MIYVKPHNLYSDKVVELHEFAGMLNLDRGYFMEGRSAYWISDDITAIKAIELGAEYVDSGDNQCNNCGNKSSILYYKNGNRWVASDKSSRSVCYRCRIYKSLPDTD